jgi:hypothetical protein
MIRYYIATAYNQHNLCKPGDALVRYQLIPSNPLLEESNVYRVRHLYDYGAPLFGMNKNDLVEFVPAKELEFSPA